MRFVTQVSTNEYINKYLYDTTSVDYRMAWQTSFCPAIALLTVMWFTRICGSLINLPKNVVAKWGDKVEFECSANETMSASIGFSPDAEGEAIPPDWKFFSATSSTDEFIYRSGYITHNFISKYSIDNTTIRGRYNLIMNSIDLSFAGTYTCSEQQFLGDDKHRKSSASAELIVIASDPVCSFNASEVIMEGDYISMWCAVNYSGNWIPIMEWTWNDGQNDYININSTNTSTAVASMLVTRLDSNDSRVTFTCKTSFKPMATHSSILQQGELLATNVPHYQHFWNYTATVWAYSSPTVPHTPGPDNGLLAVIVISVGAVILLIAISTIICKLRKRGKAKPDVVPQVEQNNFDVSDRLQPQNNPPLYAEVQRSSNGFQVMENHLMPVYATVKKERIAGDLNKQTVTNNYQQNQSIPVYAEVKKMEKEKKILGPSGQIMMSTNTKPKQNYAGADGTQYMELDSLTELTSNGILTKRPLMFNLVETYATIDHTMVAPPPPPSLPRRHQH